MALHQWSGRRLAEVWLTWLCLHIVLVLASRLWASVHRPEGLEGFTGMIIVLVLVWVAIPSGLLLTTFSWYWARRRVREIGDVPPAA